MTDTSSGVAPVVAGPPGGSGAPAPSGGGDSITAYNAGLLGAGLVALGLLAFVGTVAVTSSSAPSSLAFAAMSGVALLSLTLVGIMVLTRCGRHDGRDASARIAPRIDTRLARVFARDRLCLGGVLDAGRTVRSNGND